jgi:phage tail-like protein
MDVNGTRFHLILGHDDWARCDTTDVRYDDDRDELTLTALPFRFTGGGAVPLDPATRRGAARDRYGNWYWIDEVPTTVLVNSSDRFWGVEDATAAPHRAPGQQFEALDPPALPPPLRLAGAAVTTDHHLIVGVTEPPGLLVFDLYAGGPPEQIRWPVPFTPFDMAARPNGGVYILDREHRRYWELDSHLLVVAYGGDEPAPPPAFGPPTDEAGRLCFRPPSERDAVPLPDDPIAIEAAPDGTVLVLFRGPPAVRAYPAGPATALAVTGYDLATAGDRVFLADERGDQAYELTPDLVLLDRYYPMRLFGGKALVAAGGQAYYDVGGHWFPLAEQRLRRYRPDGVVLTGVLDSGQDGCVWHRLLLDACLPSAETTIEVSSAASDDPEALQDFPAWVTEPALHPRGDGSEQPFAPPTGHRTWELLFQRARGRYLRLRLRLAGNERATPRIRAVRVYYPRFSYLERYLPAVYREDQLSASFLDRFLANVEGIATTVEGRIAAAQILFDPAVAPPGGLEWLASWFGLALDPAWDEAKRRLLLSHAMEFLRWRGTVRGLQAALALALDRAPGDDVFADRPAACARRTRIVEGDAHRFRVLLPVSARTRIGEPDDDPYDPATRLRLATRIVELEKPAHTVFDVKFYWEAFRVGEARLGLDTLVDLGGRSPSLLPGAVLGRTYLGESYLAGDRGTSDG